MALTEKEESAILQMCGPDLTLMEHQVNRLTGKIRAIRLKDGTIRELGENEDSLLATTYFEEVDKLVDVEPFVPDKLKAFIKTDIRAGTVALLETMLQEYKQMNPDTRPITFWIMMMSLMEAITHSCPLPLSLDRWDNVIIKAAESSKKVRQTINAVLIQQLFKDMFKPDPNPNSDTKGQ